jgi:hypothetical protein
LKTHRRRLVSLTWWLVRVLPALAVPALQPWEQGQDGGQALPPPVSLSVPSSRRRLDTRRRRPFQSCRRLNSQPYLLAIHRRRPWHFLLERARMTGRPPPKPLPKSRIVLLCLASELPGADVATPSESRGVGHRQRSGRYVVQLRTLFFVGPLIDGTAADGAEHRGQERPSSNELSTNH